MRWSVNISGSLNLRTSSCGSPKGACSTIAAQALERKVGARGLRMILEDLMLDLMYHLPSQRKIREFVVTEEMVKDHEINFSSAFLEKAG